MSTACRLSIVRTSVRPGGWRLLVAGANFNPHAYRDTPLADVLPIEPSATPPPEPDERTEGYHLELTPVGSFHPIFRFESNVAANQGILQKLKPMYWHAQGYTLKPLAEVLAVHPDPKKKIPLAVQQFVGAGRSMFFGFDETWRWGFREDQQRFNQFWVQTVRYLARSRLGRIELRLDRQTPYRRAEPIKLTHRVVMSFYTAKRLLQNLHRAISIYESHYGPVEIDPQRRLRVPPPAAPRPGGS